MATEDNELGKTGNGENPKEETITELAHRHMTDPEHTTTDEELRNAKLEYSDADGVDAETEALFEEDNTTVIPPIPGEEKLTDNKDNDKEGDVPNPYEVLGS